MQKINFVISPSQQDGNKTVVKHPNADTEAELTRLVGTALFDVLSYDDRINLCLVPDFQLGDDMQNLRTAIDHSNKFIRQNGGKGFHLDLHSDGGYAGQGATGFYKSAAGAAFGKPIFDAMCALTPWDDMTFGKRDNLACLNQTDAVAYLQEISFHDKTEEAYWIFNNVNNIANTLADGFYKGVGLTRYIVPKWQYDSFIRFVQEGTITSPDYWKNRLHTPITVGEAIAIMEKARKVK